MMEQDYIVLCEEAFILSRKLKIFPALFVLCVQLGMQYSANKIQLIPNASRKPGTKMLQYIIIYFNIRAK
jgi:hypothetical protein